MSKPEAIRMAKEKNKSVNESDVKSVKSISKPNRNYIIARNAIISSLKSEGFITSGFLTTMVRHRGPNDPDGSLHFDIPDDIRNPIDVYKNGNFVFTINLDE
jgi:hypothetical protein